MLKKIFFLLFLVPGFLSAEPSQEAKQRYAEQMYQAFELQAQGLSTLAFCAFQDAYQFALASGESIQKLAPFEELFTWYQKYGRSCGVTLTPMLGENEFQVFEIFEETFYGLSPQQEKLARDFLFGIGQVISGVFFMAINPNFLGKLGAPLAVSGMKYLYESVSAMIQDHREKNLRLQELETLQKNIEASIRPNKMNNEAVQNESRNLACLF